MENFNPIPPAHKPLHHHVLEGLEHIIDEFGMYMAMGGLLIMGIALLTAGHL
jgi:hypothetical protein